MKCGKWEKWVALAVLTVALLANIVFGADDVAPATLSITNVRDEAQAYVPNGSTYYFEGTTLRLTNCTMYAGTSTNSSAQGLDSVTIDIDVGTTSTNVNYSGTAQVASNGTYYCDITVPENLATAYIQVKITDASTNVYIYPWKMIRTKDPL
jgi:uncharacterized protein (TIGR03437 family)